MQHTVVAPVAVTAPSTLGSTGEQVPSSAIVGELMLKDRWGDGGRPSGEKGHTMSMKMMTMIGMDLVAD